jgi:hypothetical protein
MSPCRQGETPGQTGTGKLTIKASHPARAGRIRRVGFGPARIRFRFVLVAKVNAQRRAVDERALPVDGLAVPLRGFRKSHHLIPAGRDPKLWAIRELQWAASVRQARVGVLRAYQPSYLYPEKQGRDGMSLLEGIIDSRNNPLAVVEDIAADHNWSFERSGEDEVTIVSKGNWTDYQLSFTWMTEIEALHLACAFDMKIPGPRRAEVQRLIAGINEQLWIGHFDIWTHTGMIMYRQALVLPGGITASTAQCESMLVGAIHACERYYPAFQFVVWAGKSALEAMSAAMFDTDGEA